MRPPTIRSLAHRRAGALGFLAASLLGWACYPAPASAPPPAVAGSEPPASACVIADTTAPTRDTLFTVGVEWSSVDVDCQGRAISAPAQPTAALTPPPGADLRDVLDRGRPDVVVTSDPELLAWAIRDSDFMVRALPWSATYVLAVAGADSASTIPSIERGALARDAVSADARGAEGPFPWLTDSTCTTVVPVPARAPRPVVAYPAGDATARQLAERVAARSPAAPRVAAMPSESISVALADGSAAAAVFRIARNRDAACRTAIVRGAAPLVDTRAHVIVRRGSGAVIIVAADGTLRFIRGRAP